MDVTLQGDHSGSSQPPVDMKTQVAFQYKPLTLNTAFALMSMGGWEQPEW